MYYAVSGGRRALATVRRIDGTMVMEDHPFKSRLWPSLNSVAQKTSSSKVPGCTSETFKAKRWRTRRKERSHGSGGGCVKPASASLIARDGGYARGARRLRGMCRGDGRSVECDSCP